MRLLGPWSSVGITEILSPLLIAGLPKITYLGPFLCRGFHHPGRSTQQASVRQSAGPHTSRRRSSSCSPFMETKCTSTHGNDGCDLHTSFRRFRFALAFLVVREGHLVKLVNDHLLLTEIRPVVLVKAWCLFKVLLRHVQENFLLGGV